MKIENDQYKSKDIGRLPIDPSLDDKRFPLLMRVVKPINGKFTKWRIGEIVRACAPRYGAGWSIRKLKMRGTIVPLVQCCCGIPKSYLEPTVASHLSKVASRTASINKKE